MSPPDSHTTPPQLEADLLKAFELEPTGDQAEAFQKLAEYLALQDERHVFVLKGAAGTGKTSMLHAVVPVMRARRTRVILLAPTGRAAKVAARRAGRPAHTIHHTIYSTSADRQGRLNFQLKSNPYPEGALYIVDEASMMDDQATPMSGRSRGILQDLLSFVYEVDPSSRILLVGDPAQLPPVGLIRSPALSRKYLLENLGLQVTQANMTQVKRQALSSGILVNATRLRQAMVDGLKGDIPALSAAEDVQVLESPWEALDLFQEHYDPDDPDKVVLLTHSNRVAANFNQSIRPRLHDDPGQITLNDIVMVVKNYYFQQDGRLGFVANGETGIVRQIYWETQEQLAELTWVDVELSFTDERNRITDLCCKVPLDLLYANTPKLTAEQTKAIHDVRLDQRRQAKRPTTREAMRQDPYVNCLQLKMGYAITGHKAQGGQWAHVIAVFDDYQFRPRPEQDADQALLEAVRWTYTVLTRAADTLYLLQYPQISPPDNGTESLQ